jgi:hypothetical protein
MEAEEISRGFQYSDSGLRFIVLGSVPGHNVARFASPNITDRPTVSREAFSRLDQNLWLLSPDIRQTKCVFPKDQLRH